MESRAIPEGHVGARPAPIADIRLARHMFRMAVISIVFPSSDGASFDYEYAQSVHLPLVLARWRQLGLKKVELLRGLTGADGGAPPFLAMGLLRFTSLRHLQTAITGEHAAEIRADIARFTNVQPILQVNAGMGQ